jgi:hypothetical protein
MVQLPPHLLAVQCKHEIVDGKNKFKLYSMYSKIKERYKDSLLSMNIIKFYEAVLL